MAHLNFETLLDYVEGLLSSETTAEVETHLNQPCPRCRALVGRITEVTNLMLNDQTQAPPRAVLQRMLATLHRHAAVNRPRVPATLVFNSWQHAPLAAVRGPGQAQQLLYSAEGLDIDLHLTAGQNDTTVRGQILGAARDAAQPTPVVVLYTGGDFVATTTTDRLGQFVFQSLPSGTYDLHIELDDANITIEGIRLDR
jgi:hypothetical protein